MFSFCLILFLYLCGIALNEQKKNGNKTYILRATEVNKLFEVSQICGGQRYPMICQAMEYASRKYKGIQIEGKNPSSSFTVEYKLTCF